MKAYGGYTLLMASVKISNNFMVKLLLENHKILSTTMSVVEGLQCIGQYRWTTLMLCAFSLVKNTTLSKMCRIIRYVK